MRGRAAQVARGVAELRKGGARVARVLALADPGQQAGHKHDAKGLGRVVVLPGGIEKLVCAMV